MFTAVIELLPAGAEAPTHRHVHFANPNGVVVASLISLGTGSRDQSPQYALIHDDAVYALLNGADPADDFEPFRLCSVEVEGRRWVGLRPTGEDQPLLTLYEDVASDLSIYGDLEAADLPDPVGIFEAGVDEDLYMVQIARGRLIQPGLLALALAVLVDTQEM
ncbi:MAG: hypothetical protein R3C44_02595 [Chloroflexota bacterium]